MVTTILYGMKKTYATRAELGEIHDFFDQNDGTLMYYGSNNSWSTLTKQTDMPHKLSYKYNGHSCGTTEEDGQVTEVVAAGGYFTPNDVFIFNLESGASRSGVVHYS